VSDRPGSEAASVPPPRIFLPPPLLFAAGFGAGLAIHRWLPGDALPGSLADPVRWLGLALAIAGATFSFSAVATFWRAGTTALPFRAATRLVTHGPYRFARNPMYTGLTAVYIGLALAWNRIWPFAFLPVVFSLLMRHVVGPEERYLEARFGDAYRAYRARVRRFLVV
jgi:protein-S-isoprenylcysteine O-methyltransferase Ste14